MARSWTFGRDGRRSALTDADACAAGSRTMKTLPRPTPPLLRLDASSVELHHFPDDGQSKAQTALRTVDGLPALHEHLEDIRQHLRRNADPVVADMQFEHAAVPARFDLDPPMQPRCTSRRWSADSAPPAKAGRRRHGRPSRAVESARTGCDDALPAAGSPSRWPEPRSRRARRAPAPVRPCRGQFSRRRADRRRGASNAAPAGRSPRAPCPALRRHRGATSAAAP